MRVTCTNCGGAHTTWDCKRPAKKSTAARKDVLGDDEGRMGPRQPNGSVDGPPSAGTQALPVDTNSSPSEQGLQHLAPEGVITTSAGTVGNADRPPIQKRPRGRPKSITDMAAYKAAKQREYRAKWKGRE